MKTVRHGIRGIDFLNPNEKIKWKESLHCFKEIINKLTQQNSLEDFAKQVFGILVLRQVHSLPPPPPPKPLPFFHLFKENPVAHIYYL